MNSPLIHSAIAGRAFDASLTDRLGAILAGPSLPGAACARRGRDGKPLYPPDLWFPHANGSERSNTRNAAPALQICRRCPQRRPCLQWALQLDPIPGVWGGMTEGQRGQLRRRHAEKAETA